MVSSPAIPEILETDVGEALSARTASIATWRELGPPDLVHLGKSSTPSRTAIKDIGTYFFATGVDISSSASVAAYLNTLTYLLGEEQVWFGKHPHWRVHTGTYCSYNAFSKVDVRVIVQIPGGVDAYTVDENGIRRELISDTPNQAIIWQETYLSAILRSIVFADDDSYYLTVSRNICPIQSVESEQRFFEAIEAHFSRGWQLGSPPTVQVPNIVSNILTYGLFKYLKYSGRYVSGQNLLEKIYAREPETASLLARAFLEGDEEVKAVSLMHSAIKQNPRDGNVLILQADFCLEKDKYEFAIATARQAVKSAPSEFESWFKLAEVYVAVGDYEQALVTLNSCPMYTYTEHDGHRMPQSMKIHLPLPADGLTDEILDWTDTKDGVTSAATSATASSFLQYAVPGSGDNNSNNNSTSDNSPSSASNSTQNNHSNKHNSFSSGGNNLNSLRSNSQLNGASNNSINPNNNSDSTTYPNNNTNSSTSGTSGANNNTHSLGSNNASNNNLNGNYSSSKSNGSNINISAGYLSGTTPFDDERCDPVLLRLPAASLRGTFAQAYSLLAKIVYHTGWDNLLQLRSKVFVMEDEYRSERNPGSTDQAEEENNMTQTSIEKPSNAVSAVSASSPTSANNENVDISGLSENEKFASFRHKRLCERWLDNLFMVLYEDLRVHTIWKAQFDYYKANNISVHKSAFEWEILGLLAKRLGYKDEAVEALCSAAVTRFTPKVHWALLELFLERQEDDKVIDVVIRLSSWNHRWYVEWSPRLFEALRKLVAREGATKIRSKLLSKELPAATINLIEPFFGLLQSYNARGASS